jgi:hypothetical protein
MRTTVVDDVAPWANDQKLMARLDGMSAPLPPGVANLRIGIEGPHRKVYRVIETGGIVEAIRVFETLRGMGLAIDGGRRAGGLQLDRVFRQRS